MQGNGSTTLTEPVEATITLTPLKIQRVNIPLRGVTPVIPHKWSEKALRMMREKQSGSKARPAHTAKVPEEEAESATYYLPDGETPGIPATAFKAAIVDSTRFFQGITMVQAKQAFFVEGEGPDQLVPLIGERFIREDTPRNQTGVADLRYRYAYWPWTTTLAVSFVTVVVDTQSVLSLVSAAGLGGVGDWRPSAPKSKTGTFGRFEIDPERSVEIMDETLGI